MKPRIRSGTLLSALAAVILFSVGTAVGAEGDEKAVREAAAQFYSALNAMFTGALEPMKKVWSHAEDVTYMGPGGGFRVGWSEVLQDWEKQAAMKLGGKVEAVDMRLRRDLQLVAVDDLLKRLLHELLDHLLTNRIAKALLHDRRRRLSGTESR